MRKSVKDVREFVIFVSQSAMYCFDGDTNITT